MRPLIAFLAAAFTLPAFAGCIGDGGPAAAQFTATPLSADQSSYRFDASPSTGEGLVYSWDFGDQSPLGEGKIVDHTYEYLNGLYSVKLTVTDSAGLKSELTQKVQAGEGANSDPFLYLSADKRLAKPDEEILFDASLSTDPDGDPIRFQWDFNSQLDDDALNNMENLGWQQYGRYTKAPAPSGGGNNTQGGNTSGNGTLLTPSGHDWTKEYEEAAQRALERAGVGGLHGGEPGANPEERNTEFDGRVADGSPIQIFSFPGPATYYVHVRVLDIKGTLAEGFLRIRIAEEVPEGVVSDAPKGSLKPSTLSAANDQDQLRSSQFHPVSFDHAGALTMTLTFTSSAPAGLSAEAGAFFCGSAIAEGQCEGSSQKIPYGPSGRTLTITVTPDRVGAYKVLVKAGSQSAPFDYTLTRTLVFDLNPWALDESGLGSAAHH